MGMKWKWISNQESYHERQNCLFRFKFHFPHHLEKQLVRDHYSWEGIAQELIKNDSAIIQ